MDNENSKPTRNPGSFLSTTSEDYSALRTTPGLKITGAMVVATALVVISLCVAVWSLFQPSRALNIGRADNEPIGSLNEECPLAPGMVKDLYAQDMTTFFYLAVRRTARSTGVLQSAWDDRFGTSELMTEVQQGLAFPADVEELVSRKKFENPADEYLAGLMELYGIEVPLNETRGLVRLRSAARKGYTAAIRQYAILLSSLDDHLPEDFEKMFRFASHAGNCGDRIAYLTIVRQIEKLTPGKTSPVHKLLLSSWYKKAGIVDDRTLPAPEVAGRKRKTTRPAKVMTSEETGDPIASQNLVTPTRPVAGVERDADGIMRAARLLDRGGDGVVMDRKKAFAMFVAEAEKGNARAQVIVGERLLKGDGQTKDLATARRWFEKAANLGDTAGAAYLGAMLIDGEGGPRDLAGAEKWLAIAADHGDVEAMRSLVMVYKLTGKTAEREQLEAQLQKLSPGAATRLVH